jgi:hypothetical protein
MGLHYVGWCRKALLSWEPVVEAASLDTCYRLLLEYVRGQPVPAVASAVLPVGVHPGPPDYAKAVRASESQ